MYFGELGGHCRRLLPASRACHQRCPDLCTPDLQPRVCHTAPCSAHAIAPVVQATRPATSLPTSPLLACATSRRASGAWGQCAGRHPCCCSGVCGGGQAGTGRAPAGLRRVGPLVPKAYEMHRASTLQPGENPASWMLDVAGGSAAGGHKVRWHRRCCRSRSSTAGHRVVDGLRWQGRKAPSHTLDTHAAATKPPPVSPSAHLRVVLLFQPSHLPARVYRYWFWCRAPILWRCTPPVTC